MWADLINLAKGTKHHGMYNESSVNNQSKQKRNFIHYTQSRNKEINENRLLSFTTPLHDRNRCNRCPVKSHPSGTSLDCKRLGTAHLYSHSENSANQKTLSHFDFF